MMLYVTIDPFLSLIPVGGQGFHDNGYNPLMSRFRRTFKAQTCRGTIWVHFFIPNLFKASKSHAWTLLGMFLLYRPILYIVITDPDTQWHYFRHFTWCSSSAFYPPPKWIGSRASATGWQEGGQGLWGGYSTLGGGKAHSGIYRRERPIYPNIHYGMVVIMVVILEYFSIMHSSNFWNTDLHRRRPCLLGQRAIASAANLHCERSSVRGSRMKHCSTTARP